MPELQRRTTRVRRLNTLRPSPPASAGRIRPRRNHVASGDVPAVRLFSASPCSAQRPTCSLLSGRRPEGQHSHAFDANSSLSAWRSRAVPDEVLPDGGLRAGDQASAQRPRRTSHISPAPPSTLLEPASTALNTCSRPRPSARLCRCSRGRSRRSGSSTATRASKTRKSCARSSRKNVARFPLTFSLLSQRSWKQPRSPRPACLAKLNISCLGSRPQAVASASEQPFFADACLRLFEARRLPT